MKVNWDEFNYSLFRETSPKIIQTFFGMDLEFERNRSRSGLESFVFSTRGEKVLGVVQQEEKINPDQIPIFIQEIMSTGASAGLVVSSSPQPFRFLFFEKAHACWFPVVIWGRK
jgi:hypothetical protein